MTLGVGDFLDIGEDQKDRAEGKDHNQPRGLWRHVSTSVCRGASVRGPGTSLL